MRKFELPAIFAKFIRRIDPPEKNITENRHVDDAVNCPNLQFYNPEMLHFPDKMLPTIPGMGGYVTCGLDMVVYDGQPQWDRFADAGPVRDFFRQTLDDRLVIKRI